MIRTLSNSDFDVFKTIRSEALSSDPDAFGETKEAFDSRDDDELRKRYADLTSGRKKIVAAFVGDTPVAMCGFGISEEDEKNGFLWGMYVSPSHRKLGIGRDLLKEAEKWIAENRGEKISSCVAAPNDGAITFYKYSGYEIMPVSGVLRDGSDVPVHPIRKEKLG